MYNPNFDNLLKVLRREVPNRPTLFEFFLNDHLYTKLVEDIDVTGKHELDEYRRLIHAFKNAGYDYATVKGSDFNFYQLEIKQDKTRSLNDGFIITDRESFNKYPWANAEDFDYSRLKDIEDEIPKGMKLIVWGPGGVLENTINLVGFDNLCYMLYEDPELLEDIFQAIGSRFVKYYEICSKFDSVGALISNDDWGFNTQTMLSPRDLRKYVFPWHKRIVDVIHAAGKPAILHSCGNADSIMDDIIDDMGYDGKHSFEDNILSVEDSYDRWGRRIAILGGIDLDFVCRSTPKEVKERSAAMLKRVESRGGYALGTGNSVPEYIPDENYFAMTSAALDYRV